MTDRKPVVAYLNQRLILMLKHADCVEFKSRAEFCGRVFEHSALVWREGEAFICLGITTLAGTADSREATPEAFLKPQEVHRHAISTVAFAQGWKEGG